MYDIFTSHEGISLNTEALKEFEKKMNNADVIYKDNQSVIALTKNPKYHAQTKRIDIQYHFVRDCVENDKVKLKDCLTTGMITDALTKL